MNAVVFRIAAPLASWAETGTQYRPTDLVPTWSALVGMVGAAFGWQRGDERLVQLAQTYRPAFSLANVGQRITDFHTIQSPDRPRLKGNPPRTRAEELARSADKINTSITRREYVQSADYVVALAQVDPSTIGPEQIASALNQPVYPLYAGRRSCPLGAFSAELVDGDTVDDWIDSPTHWDVRLPCGLGASVLRERRDLLERATEPRRFGTRIEAVL